MMAQILGEDESPSPEMQRLVFLVCSVELEFRAINLIHDDDSMTTLSLAQT